MSRVEDILQCLIDGETYDGPVSSRVEEILVDSYEGDPKSRVEALLLALTNSGEYDGPILSRIEDILLAKLNDTEYEGPVLSNVESLLLEWEPGGLIPDIYEKVKGFTFSNSYFTTPIKLSGSDTIRFIFSYDRPCNVLGSYLSTSSEANFSFYATSSAYMRYDGHLYRPSISSNTKYEAVASPTGFSLNGTKVSTWTEEEFTSDDNMMIGMLPNSSSPSFTGYFEGPIVVDGKLNCVPVKRIYDDELGYYDTVSKTFLTNEGSGSFTILS